MLIELTLAMLTQEPEVPAQKPAEAAKSLQYRIDWNAYHRYNPGPLNKGNGKPESSKGLIDYGWLNVRAKNNGYTFEYELAPPYDPSAIASSQHWQNTLKRNLASGSIVYDSDGLLHEMDTLEEQWMEPVAPQYPFLLLRGHGQRNLTERLTSRIDKNTFTSYRKIVFDTAIGDEQFHYPLEKRKNLYASPVDFIFSFPDRLADLAKQAEDGKAPAFQSVARSQWMVELKFVYRGEQVVNFKDWTRRLCRFDLMQIAAWPTDRQRKAHASTAARVWLDEKHRFVLAEVSEGGNTAAPGFYSGLNPDHPRNRLWPEFIPPTRYEKITPSNPGVHPERLKDNEGRT